MNSGQMLDAIKNWVKELCDCDVKIGLPDIGSGVWINTAATGVLDVFYNRDERRDFTLTIYVKNTSQLIAITQAAEIGRRMGRAKTYPQGDGWAVLTMQDGGAIYVSREESRGLWLYVNNIEVTYFS